MIYILCSNIWENYILLFKYIYSCFNVSYLAPFLWNHRCQKDCEVNKISETVKLAKKILNPANISLKELYGVIPSLHLSVEYKNEVTWIQNPHVNYHHGKSQRTLKFSWEKKMTFWPYTPLTCLVAKWNAYNEKDLIPTVKYVLCERYILVNSTNIFLAPMNLCTLIVIHLYCENVSSMLVG